MPLSAGQQLFLIQNMTDGAPVEEELSLEN